MMCNVNHGTLVIAFSNAAKLSKVKQNKTEPPTLPSSLHHPTNSPLLHGILSFETYPALPPFYPHIILSSLLHLTLLSINPPHPILPTSLMTHPTLFTPPPPLLPPSLLPSLPPSLPPLYFTLSSLPPLYFTLSTLPLLY